MPQDFAALKAANRELNYREIREGRTRLRSKPLYFWFDIYGPCNLKCVHCGFHKEGRTSEEEVSELVYRSVIAELMPTADTCNLGGTNWGEATISKNFARFLGDCRQHGVKVNLTTNGTRMNDAWVGELADVASVVGFSMEGMDAEFEKIRGFPWRRFRENIEKLVQVRRERGRSFRIEWRYCAHADSIHQLPDMIRLASEMGIDRIQVMTLIPYVRAQKYKNLTYHRSLANHYFGLARAMAADFGVRVTIPDDFNTGAFAPSLIQIQKSGATPKFEPQALELVNCYKPWQACSINELGDVKPCGIYWRPTGRIQSGGFEAVWNGYKYRALRASVNRSSDAICFACRRPQFDSEDGRLAAELSPSPRQIAMSVIDRLRSRQRARYVGAMDATLDPYEESEGPRV